MTALRLDQLNKPMEQLKLCVRIVLFNGQGRYISYKQAPRQKECA